MSTESNKAIARRFYEILNNGRFDQYQEILSDDFIDHNPVPGQAPGLAGLKQALAGFCGAFPDLHFEIEDMVACDDRVVVRTTGRGTHKGDFMGVPPTGKRVEFMAVDIHRIGNNRIRESWHLEDLLSVMLQLGAVQLPTEAKT